MSALSLPESARLVALEEVIERGLSNFIKVGEALAEIRDSKLYRIEYATFEDYCREEWEMSRPSVYRLIGAAQVSANLSPIGDTESPRPSTESQVRPLTKLPDPAQQRAAWEDAVQQSNGKPTAKHVEQAVSRIRPITTEPTEQEQAAATQAARESQTLYSLKRYWRKASKRDRAAFKAWMNNNQ